MNNIGRGGFSVSMNIENNNSYITIEDKKKEGIFTIRYHKGDLIINRNSKIVDFDDFLNSHKSVFRDFRYYFTDNIVTNYAKNNNNISTFLLNLRFAIKFLNEKGGLNNEELLVFLKEIFVNYKYVLKKIDKENYITNVKFFIANVVPEFINEIKYKYNNSKDISCFIEYLMSINDINFQSKIIDGLLNSGFDGLNKSFFLDVLENLDLNKLSMKDVSRLYSILSRQNSDKAAIKLLKKIHFEYISKLNDSDVNKFTDYFCKDINSINYFENKANINVANYSQSMINYFTYLAKNRKFNCFKRFLSSIRENIKDVEFDKFNLNDKLEECLIEQITKSIECRNQEDNLMKFFERKNRKYKDVIVSNLASSIFYDGISNKNSAKFLVVRNRKTFEKAVKKNINSLDLTNDRKDRILLNNRETLYRLSEMKTFKDNFLNDESVVNFLNNSKINYQDKNFLLNFYINRILFNKNSFSRVKLIAYIQRKNRLLKVKKFTSKLSKNSILKIDNIEDKTVNSFLRKELFLEKKRKFTKKVLRISKNNSLFAKSI